LSLPALVVGSISPDLGYFFGTRKVDEFSHRLLGSIGFCLPVGLMLLAVFYRFRASVVGKLPQRYQRALQPLSTTPPGSIIVNVFSLWVGCCTHLVWDSFTHRNGWGVTHIPALHAPIALVAGRTVRVCHVLWYLCSFVGIILVFLSYMRAQRIRTGTVSRSSDRADVVFAALVALLLLPIELVHHLLGPSGLVLAGISTLLLLLVILRRIGRELSDDPMEQLKESDGVGNSTNPRGGSLK
jgi:hypothetical protein